ncbi:hypothetical protein HKB01_03065, partial [Vibrio parahaemolyticus]|nr:hypothetical protein [Vibrio parahaemolyticus]
LVGYKPEIIHLVIPVIIYFSAFAAIMSSAIRRIFANRRNKEALITEPQIENIEEDVGSEIENLEKNSNKEAE